MTERVYLRNDGRADAMVAEKWLMPGTGRVVTERMARTAMANYPDLTVVPAEDAPIDRYCKVLRSVKWRGGMLPAGGRAWFADGEWRPHREKLEIIFTELDQ